MSQTYSGLHEELFLLKRAWQHISEKYSVSVRTYCCVTDIFISIFLISDVSQESRLSEWSLFQFAAWSHVFTLESRCLPLCVHENTGAGLPVASHSRVASSPMYTVTSGVETVTVGGEPSKCGTQRIW